MELVSNQPQTGAKNRDRLVSICIPTYQRPELLEEAVASCLAQDYEPIEIIIGDDSKDDATERLIPRLRADCPCRLRYVHNAPSLGQAGNVNKLFEMAEGDRLVLLHDDDLLLPNALSDLDRCWHVDAGLTAAFGKQHVISMNGTIRDRASEKLNDAYYRTGDKEGMVLSAMESALLQQFPSDGYMVRSSAARKTKYRAEDEVGTSRWCDFDFGIRLASTFDKFYFVNEFTAKYRLTDESISGQDRPAYMYPLIKSLYVDEPAAWAQREALERLAPTVVRNYAHLGQRREAWRIYKSEFYSSKRRNSLKGLYHLLLIASPSLAKRLRRVYAMLRGS